MCDSDLILTEEGIKTEKARKELMAKWEAEDILDDEE
jgi:hypothetical protein